MRRHAHWVSIKRSKGRDTACHDSCNRSSGIWGFRRLWGQRMCLRNKMKQSSIQILKCNPGSEWAVPRKLTGPRGLESHYLPGRRTPGLTWMYFRETHGRLQIGEEREGTHGRMGSSTAMVLSWGHFSSPENSWQCVGTFLMITEAEGIVLLASCGLRPGMLINML